MCDITGLQAHVVRYWESQFPMLAPQKNRAGQRTYRKRDVEMVLRIKELLYEDQYTIAGAKKRLTNDLRGASKLKLVDSEKKLQVITTQDVADEGNYNTDTEIELSSDKLTPLYLSVVVSPFLNAIAEVQAIINEIKGRDLQGIVIKSIRQSSPLDISLNGAAEAIQQIKDTVVPWRRKHLEKMALLLEKEKQAEIGNRKAEILEKRARSIKDNAEAERIAADAAKQREETERIRLENEKLRLELQRSKIQLALDVLAQVAPNLSETEKIAYVVKLLPPLEILASSELEIMVNKGDADGQ